MSQPGPRVGFIGLGIMGSRMAANARRAGFELTVWNRTRSIAEDFATDHGASLAESPAALAAVSDIVVTMVVDGAMVEEVLLGAEGVAAGASAGLRCVDCSTIGPDATLRVAAGLARRECTLLDAPVTGSAPRAEDATLTIMVGGERADVEHCRPLLESMGSRVIHVGRLGDGQRVKLINNAVAAANAATVAEALLLGRAMDLDLDALRAVMDSGSGASAMLSLKAGAMLAHDYAPLFKLEHMLKDVELCLAASAASGTSFESATRVAADLMGACELGFGASDFASLVEAVERRAGRRL